MAETRKVTIQGKTSIWIVHNFNYTIARLKCAPGWHFIAFHDDETAHVRYYKDKDHEIGKVCWLLNNPGNADYKGVVTLAGKRDIFDAAQPTLGPNGFNAYQRRPVGDTSELLWRFAIFRDPKDGNNAILPLLRDYFSGTSKGASVRQALVNYKAVEANNSDVIAILESEGKTKEEAEELVKGWDSVKKQHKVEEHYLTGVRPGMKNKAQQLGVANPDAKVAQLTTEGSSPLMTSIADGTDDAKIIVAGVHYIEGWQMHPPGLTWSPNQGLDAGSAPRSDWQKATIKSLFDLQTSVDREIKNALGL